MQWKPRCTLLRVVYSSILDLKKEGTGTSRKYWKGSAEEKNRYLTLPIKYDLKPARV